MLCESNEKASGCPSEVRLFAIDAVVIIAATGAVDRREIAVLVLVQEFAAALAGGTLVGRDVELFRICADKAQAPMGREGDYVAHSRPHPNRDQGNSGGEHAKAGKLTSVFNNGSEEVHGAHPVW